MQLWVEKYKPKRLEEVTGQNKAVESIGGWLGKWKPGKGLLITGQTGIGKSLIPEVICFERGWQLIHVNANDVSSYFDRIYLNLSCLFCIGHLLAP